MKFEFVEFPFTSKRKPRKKELQKCDGVKKALIIPDLHVPYHDRKAFELMLKVAKDFCPDEIVYIGDVADFYCVSSHGKDPGIKIDFVEEITEVKDILRRVERLFPKSKKVFIEGNHEYRLHRYLCKKAPELFGTLTVPELLGIEDYEFVPYSPSQKYHILGGKLIARHENIGGGKHGAASSVEKAGKSVMFGHSHRIQEFQTVTIDGENHRGINIGWLGDKTHPVMQYVKNHHQWALGFALVHVLPDGTFFSQTIHIIEYQCFANGRYYRI